MDLKVRNFYGLKDFHMNMSYPKKIKDSMLEPEHLTQRENFRYKKLNIIMGGNATGKTSIGKIIMKIFNFISKQTYSIMTDVICDNTQAAYFSIDLATATAECCEMYRIETTVAAREDREYTVSDIAVSVRRVDIKKNDSYESCARALDAMPYLINRVYTDALEGLERTLTWMFAYPFQEDRVDCKRLDERDMAIYDYVLRTLDPAILSVEKLKEVDDSFIIRAKNYQFIVQDGVPVRDSFLSSGTKSGLAVANMLVSMKQGRREFYYCDEKFSYVHSSVEKAFLSLMIELLGSNQQLFFTTHNMDILELPLPKHTFTFLKKTMVEDDFIIECINAGSFLKRNTDSLRCAVENDLFATEPSTELLYQIADM